MIDNKTIKTVRVKASGEYSILIGEGLISDAGKYVKEVVDAKIIAVITDDIVDALYGKSVCDSLKDHGFSVVKMVFPNGEESKNLTTYGQILNFLAENGLTRTDAIVALGGGVVGDMAGFAAATYMRGIKFVQIPTTLLAQIDSSVGGKTAVDLPSGKNLVGAFHQPSLVLCDTLTLSSLPKEIFDDGMGEAAKYAVLDKKIYQLVSGEGFDVSELVYLSVDYKRQIVEADEFESGKRKLLNLGHTVAHGIEKLSEYKISHGKAVRMGLDVIVDSCFKRGELSQIDYEKIKAALNKCVKSQALEYSIKDVACAALNDKKRSGNKISLMTVHGIGDVRESKIDVLQLEEYLK